MKSFADDLSFGRGAVLGGAAPRCDPLRLIRSVRPDCPLLEGHQPEKLEVLAAAVKGKDATMMMVAESQCLCQWLYQNLGVNIIIKRL